MKASFETSGFSRQNRPKISSLKGGHAMKDYVAEFQKKIDAINADAQRVNIINAGVMDHGKSSLFNSLLDKIVFAEQDIRTTVKIQAELWRDNVYLIDTPGLSAETIDDATAYEAYRRANVILFVHNLNTGELHKNGLDGINRIKNLFADQKFFAEHFCLVFTFIDSQRDDEKLNTIIDKALADIKNHCGLSGIRVFHVSNPRYRKGRDEKKAVLFQKSGIPELREYLEQNFDRWRAENQSVRNAQIAREKDDFISQLRRERADVQSRIQSKSEQIRQRQQNFLHKVETALSQRREDESRYNSESRLLDEMRRDLQNLRDRWNRERY